MLDFTDVLAFALTMLAVALFAVMIWAGNRVH